MRLHPFGKIEYFYILATSRKLLGHLVVFYTMYHKRQNNQTTPPQYARPRNGSLERELRIHRYIFYKIVPFVPLLNLRMVLFLPLKKFFCDHDTLTRWRSTPKSRDWAINSGTERRGERSLCIASTLACNIRDERCIARLEEFDIA